jgi:hypothetical protein
VQYTIQEHDIRLSWYACGDKTKPRGAELPRLVQVIL